MKTVKVIVATALVAAVMAPAAGMAAEASVGVDVASAYVFRGGTLNDGFVAQPYLEVSGEGPLSVGVWANLDIDDMDGALEGGEFSEIDLYASYALPIEAVDVSLGYTEYTYPMGGEADREFGLGIGLPVVLSPSLGIYYGVDGAVESSIYAEAGVETGFDIAEGASVSCYRSVKTSHKRTNQNQPL